MSNMRADMIACARKPSDAKIDQGERWILRETKARRASGNTVGLISDITSVSARRQEVVVPKDCYSISDAELVSEKPPVDEWCLLDFYGTLSDVKVQGRATDRALLRPGATWMKG